jgi:hypothetical protein
MSRAASALCAAILIGAGAYYPFVKIRFGAEQEYGAGGYDIYAYFYPNIRYALDSLARGDGVLWNPYQDCGQPFFAFSITGLLYPVNWIFALLPREAALLTSMTVNLGIAGLGAWWLGREMGLSRAAALAGGLAFAYSVSAILLAAWSPMHISPYAWMPVALAAVERLLRVPSPRHGALLGLALTLQLLPGFPQTCFFTYQVIALRVVWEFATRRVHRPLALVGWLGMGLALPPRCPPCSFCRRWRLRATRCACCRCGRASSARASPSQGARTGIGQSLVSPRRADGQRAGRRRHRPGAAGDAAAVAAVPADRAALPARESRRHDAGVGPLSAPPGRQRLPRARAVPLDHELRPGDGLRPRRRSRDAPRDVAIAPRGRRRARRRHRPVQRVAAARHRAPRGRVSGDRRRRADRRGGVAAPRRRRRRWPWAWRSRGIRCTPAARF